MRGDVEIPILVLGKVTEWASALRRRAPEVSRGDKGARWRDGGIYRGGLGEERGGTVEEAEKLSSREKRDGKTRDDHGSMGLQRGKANS